MPGRSSAARGATALSGALLFAAVALAGCGAEPVASETDVPGNGVTGPNTGAGADTRETDTADTGADTTLDTTGTTDTIGPDPGHFDLRMAGDWLLDQPFHALYEAAIYRFHAEGQVELLYLEPADCTGSGQIPPLCETGVVSDSERTVYCVFDGAQWDKRRDEAVLTMKVPCTDLQDRELRLKLEGNFNLGQVTSFEVISVDGDTTWVHPWPEWQLSRCVGEPTSPYCCLDPESSTCRP